jgi:hypothetical protein
MSAEETPQPRVGQVWRTPDGKRLTISGIEGDSIDCNRHDPKTLVTDAYVVLETSSGSTSSRRMPK